MKICELEYVPPVYCLNVVGVLPVVPNLHAHGRDAVLLVVTIEELVPTFILETAYARRVEINVISTTTW